MYKITKLKGNLKFQSKHPLMHTRPHGCCIEKIGEGFLGFDQYTPYIPQGGKKVLESLLSETEFIESLKVIKPMGVVQNERTSNRFQQRTDI